MSERKTAGELSRQASSDSTKYDPLEVGHALKEDVEAQLYEAARRHRHIFDEKEYCVGFVIAGDPLIKNLMRRKFFATLFLPKPRPNQSIFLYDKERDEITKRLWVLPDAEMMAVLSENSLVSHQYRTMKMWSDAFFKGWVYEKETDRWINTRPHHFFDVIRRESNIKMLSESEYLEANREKLIQSLGDDTPPPDADAFDFSKVNPPKVTNSKDIVFN